MLFESVSDLMAPLKGFPPLPHEEVTGFTIQSTAPTEVGEQNSNINPLTILVQTEHAQVAELEMYTYEGEESKHALYTLLTLRVRGETFIVQSLILFARETLVLATYWTGARHFVWKFDRSVPIASFGMGHQVYRNTYELSQGIQLDFARPSIVRGS
jgi:hypothetical protein